MDEGYSIVQVDDPDDGMWEVVGRGLQRFNIQQAGDDQWKRLCFILYTPDKKIAGGLIGSTYWGWFYIDLLFLKEEFRGHGHGHRILTLAEDEARQRGARNVYLDTFSFQSPEFYKKHGYQVFGELSDFPPGHQRFFLTKQL